MLYLILAIIALGVLTAAAGLFRNKKAAAPAPPQTAPSACCGQHEVCERYRLPATPDSPACYYDDEELDRFRGTESHAYDDDAAGEFREILYTLRAGEAAPWLHSLQQRGINLPDSLKDEAFLLMGEHR
jgi:hypothetical protein